MTEKSPPSTVIYPNRAVYLALLPHEDGCEAVRTGPISSCECIASKSVLALQEAGVIHVYPGGASPPGAETHA